MPFERRSLSLAARCLLIGAIALLVAPSGALAGAPDATPALQESLQPNDQIAREITTTGCAQTALATPAIPDSVPVLAADSLLTSNLVPNPCYQFDNPSTGCYYKWRSSDFCCISPAAWCPAICY